MCEWLSLPPPRPPLNPSAFADRRAKSFSRSWSDPTPVKPDSLHDSRDSESMLSQTLSHTNKNTDSYSRVHAHEHALLARTHTTRDSAFTHAYTRKAQQLLLKTCTWKRTHTLLHVGEYRLHAVYIHMRAHRHIRYECAYRHRQNKRTCMYTCTQRYINRVLGCLCVYS